MGLFDFFKQASPTKLADQLFQHAVRIDISQEMKIHLASAAIDVDRYRNEQQLVQLYWTQNLLYSAAYSKENKFFQNTSELFGSKFYSLVEERQYFGFENKYSLNDHLHKYYTFESADKMVSMLFHALRNQNLIVKSDDARRVFTEYLRLFTDGMKEIVLPHIRRELG
ncbi:hypothetical protein [Serpentinimonas barnesii]|uniref:hypothetical protein n=1 Tax=Serpentinimonas barnesii TaxID=1458427 RepID=UPI0004984841|nr:hypothetical protein [Serpentinimonas barnesii]MBT9166641.1 hypothetical protein [Chloroflexota bacterium]